MAHIIPPAIMIRHGASTSIRRPTDPVLDARGALSAPGADHFRNPQCALTFSQKICAVTLPALAEANRYPETVALASATPRSRSSRKRLRSVFGEQPMILAMSS